MVSAGRNFANFSHNYITRVRRKYLALGIVYEKGYRVHIGSSLPLHLDGGYGTPALLYGTAGSLGSGRPGKQGLRLLRDGEVGPDAGLLGGHEELLPRRAQAPAKRPGAKARGNLGRMGSGAGGCSAATSRMERAADDRARDRTADGQWTAFGRTCSYLPAQL